MANTLNVVELTNETTPNVERSVTHIYHISDIHIRLHDRIDEYEKVFDTFYTQLENCEHPESSIVVITGDIVHNKAHLSPELILCVRNMFESLASLLPTFIIMGNHDVNMTNEQRIDSLTALLDNLEYMNNIYYMKDQGIYLYRNLQFVVSSFLNNAKQIVSINDVINRLTEYNENNENNTYNVHNVHNKHTHYTIGLYHGLINNTRTYTHTIESCNVNIKDFDGYDLFLLGDNHLQQFIKPHIAYSGSMIQQDFGEKSSNHGYILWRLNELDNQIQSQSVELYNDTGFRSLVLVNDEFNDTHPFCDDITQYPSNVYLRLYLHNTTDEGIDKALKYIKHERNINILKLIHKPLNTKELMNNIVNDDDSCNSTYELNHQQLSSLEYHNTTLIPEYIRTKEPDITDDEINDLVKLNSQIYGKLSNEFKETKNNATYWKIKNIEFKGFFCYGDEINKLNFENKDGIIGIIAPNRTGKSSIVDILLFALFEKCSRGSLKDIINVGSTEFLVQVLFECGNIEYKIERSGTRKKNVVKFTKRGERGEDILLHEQTKNDTNKVIRNIVGTYDDFILTSVSLQNDISGLIKMSNSERKQQLLKQLRLNIFEQLGMLIKEDYKYNEYEIKRIRNEFVSYDKDATIVQVEQNNQYISQLTSQIEKYQVMFKQYHVKLNVYYSKLNDTNERIITQNDLNKVSEEMDTLNNQNENYDNQLNKLYQLLSSSPGLKDVKKYFFEDHEDNNEHNEEMFEENKQRNETIINDLLILRQTQLEQMDSKIEGQMKQLTKITRPNKPVTNLSSVTLGNKINTLSEKNVELENNMNETIITTDKLKMENTKLEKETLIHKNTLNEFTSSQSQFDLNNLNDLNNIGLTLNTLIVETVGMINHCTKLKEVTYDEECKHCMNNPFVNEAIEFNQSNENDEMLLQLNAKLESYQMVMDSNVDKMNMCNNQITSNNKTLMYLYDSYNNNKKLYDTNLNEILQCEKLIEQLETYKCEIDNYNQIDVENKKNEQIIYNLKSNKAKIQKHINYVNTHWKQSNATENKITETNLKWQLLSTKYNKMEEQYIQTHKINEYNAKLKKMINQMKMRCDEIEDKKIRAETECEQYERSKYMLTERIEHYTTLTIKLTELQRKHNILGRYKKMMSKEGIIYYIIIEQIKRLEILANSYLSDIVDFKLNITMDDGKSIDINIVNPSLEINNTVKRRKQTDKNDKNDKTIGHMSYPIDQGSGFEKFITNIALKQALLEISHLSRANVFIIDEGFGNFDSENLASVKNVFDYLRNKFEKVLIISHIEQLQDSIDNQINIVRDENKHCSRMIDI